MKLEIRHGMLKVTSEDTIHMARSYASVVAELIDAGHLEALRHYAQHGTLPPEPPVWDGARVKAESYGWNFYNADGDLLASVAASSGEGAPAWRCDLVVSSLVYYGDTPQAAINEARAWMRRRWCL